MLDVSWSRPTLLATLALSVTGLAAAGPTQRHVRSFQVAESGWVVTAIRSAGDPIESYSMELDSAEGGATLAITCREGALDVFVETSNPVLARFSPGYPRYTTPVRLGSSLADLGDDARFFRRPGGLGFWLYDAKGSSPFDSPVAAASSLSRQSSLVVRYQANGGGQRTSTFELGQLGRAFDAVGDSCRGEFPLQAGSLFISRFESGDPVTESPLPVDGADGLPDVPTSQQETSPYEAASLFGLWMGMTRAEVEARTDLPPQPLRDQPYTYYLSAVPRPDPALEFYLVYLGPEPDGELSEIRAVGKRITTTPDGAAVKARFQQMAETLDTSFGLQRRVDNRQVQASSDWMEQLLHKERSLSAEWTASSASTLDAAVARIRLTARAESETSARLVVQFTFTNYQPPDGQKD